MDDNNKLPYQQATKESILNLAIERYKSDVQIQCDIWNRRNVNASFPCHSNHLLQYSGLKLLSPEEYKKVQDEIIESLHKLL